MKDLMKIEFDTVSKQPKSMPQHAISGIGSDCDRAQWAENTTNAIVKGIRKRASEDAWNNVIGLFGIKR